jgi:hypothetical protein
MGRLARILRLGAAAIALCLSGTCVAEGLGLGVYASSAGVGAALTVGVLPVLNVRAGGQAFSLSRTRVESGTSYDATVRLRSAMLLVDVHPLAGSFRASAGIYYSRNEVTARSDESTFVTLDGTRYPVALFGQVSGTASARRVCPYAGIGWGNAVKAGRPVRLAVDVGVSYQGSPEIAVSAEPSIAVPPDVEQRFRADLERERQRIEDDAEDYTLYPVVSVGLSYRF